MVKVIYIKLTKVGKFDSFNIYDQYNNLIAGDVSSDLLIDGVSYTVDESVSAIKLSSTGSCAYEKVEEITTMTADSFFLSDVEITRTGCIWRHLTNAGIYNSYYGSISPYIIEYPFQYEYHDQILQSVQDYTKAYKYTANAKYSTATHIETDDDFFNKSIIYNGQQCTGILNLVPKPVRNLKEYMSYPKYNSDSKTIIFTKSDNFYQYNDFYDILKDQGDNIFIPSCTSLSIDKVVNQDNMNYSKRSFTKAPMRAKFSKIRHILDDKSNIHLVSRFITTDTQISYK